MAKKNAKPAEAPANGTTPATPDAPAPQVNNTAGARKPPAFEFRCGRIKATVWENLSQEHGKWYSVNLSRSYKDEKSGEWKQAHSYGRDDLLPASECLRQAYLWINEQLGGGTHSAKAENSATTTNGSSTGDAPIPF